MTTLATVAALLAPHQLAVMDGIDVKDDPDLPPACKTLLLIGPAEPGFWPHLTAQPEWQDGAGDPIDRWSRRVLDTVAESLGATAFFPFGGPPWHPFYRWALQSRRSWTSPVQFLLHAEMGLFASYRGALALDETLPLPPAAAKPCDSCANAPCLTACPAQALTGAGYDVPRCRRFLAEESGADCMKNGCAVRRACPRSQGYARLPEQSAFHMGQFLK